MENICLWLSEQCECFGNVVMYLEVVSLLVMLVCGYMVLMIMDGKVLKKIKQVKVGDIMIMRLEDGWFESEVKFVMLGM